MRKLWLICACIVDNVPAILGHNSTMLKEQFDILNVEGNILLTAENVALN